MAKAPLTVCIAAGGTGGHVFPALAVARELAERGCQLVWCGTRRGIEARVVPADRYPLTFLPVAGLRGRSPVRRLLGVVRLGSALLQSLVFMLKVRPKVVLAMGGYVSGPVGIAAWLTRRPLVLHEQNAVPGLTNRLLATFARSVLEAVPGAFDSAVGARPVGNPVREAIAALAAETRGPHSANAPLAVLVFGGSQGARALNDAVPEALATVAAVRPLTIRHQCGADDVAAVEQAYTQAGLVAEVLPFIDDMAAAYREADLVIARSGAMSLAEITCASLPAVLVPYPLAVDDHQTRNAAPLVAAGAAVLLPQRELTPPRLASLITDLLAEPGRLAAMASASRSLARPDAARVVADILLEGCHAR